MGAVGLYVRRTQELVAIEALIELVLCVDRGDEDCDPHVRLVLLVSPEAFDKTDKRPWLSPSHIDKIPNRQLEIGRQQGDVRCRARRVRGELFAVE